MPKNGQQTQVLLAVQYRFDGFLDFYPSLDSPNVYTFQGKETVTTLRLHLLNTEPQALARQVQQAWAKYHDQ